jgi:hypothetical protein
MAGRHRLADAELILPDCDAGGSRWMHANLKGRSMSVDLRPSNDIRSETRNTDPSTTLGTPKGPLRCAGCGYEIVSYRSLPSCPMCRQVSWEPARRRRFTGYRFER